MDRKGGRKKKKKESAMQRFIRQSRANAKAGSNLSNITAVLRNYEQQIVRLKDEIRQDNRGVSDLDKDLNPLKQRRAAILAELKELKVFCDHFDGNIGPFNRSYDQLQEGLKVRYETAKEKYAAGIKLLMDVYDYHPAYLRWHDTFTATPFKPK